MSKDSEIEKLRNELRRKNSEIRRLKNEIEVHKQDHDSLLDSLDDMLARADKGEPVRAPADKSRVRKLPKAADVGTSDVAVPAVLTRARDPSFDRKKYKYDGSRAKRPEPSEFRKRLVAPCAGTFSMTTTLHHHQSTPLIQQQHYRIPLCGARDLNCLAQRVCQDSTSTQQR